MTNKHTQLSNPASTGGKGEHFEAHIQASFVILMLTGGYAPCLPCWPITEINLQGKIDGYDTDDLIVTVEQSITKKKRKLLGQVKLKISITQKNPIFSKAIQAAWNDFNNPSVFTRGEDIIALITGPLNATDFDNVQFLLSQARSTKNFDEFNRNITKAKFSPSKCSEKLDAIKHHLKLANNDSDITNDELYSFLNHFHILAYDLGNEFGVVLSLLNSHISQFNQQNAHWIFSRAVDIVQTFNQSAGTITPGGLPQDFKEAFKQPAAVHIPEEFTESQPESINMDWSNNPYAHDLALANMIGSWNEENEADVAALVKLSAIDYSDWQIKVREILHLPGSPFKLKNGRWMIQDRKGLWGTLSSHIYDQNLDNFRETVVTVLTERDPAFEIPLEERLFASLNGKVNTHSPTLKKGLAEGLALIGNRPDALIHCSPNKSQSLAPDVVREIFTNADWVLWGSLNSLLPTLAEAAPKEFLNAVDQALRKKPCVFDKLFSQEGDCLVGYNYLSGLIWSLEVLAWEEEFLVCVCVILGDLARRDPGRDWSNRPSNSLTTILLPWLPQTTASIEKRKVAVTTLCNEWPEIGWELLISLLPSQHETSMGSRKPSWRETIPKDWDKAVTKKEYWQQVSGYAELAVSKAGYDTKKLAELINHLDDLPKPAVDQLLGVLLSDAISDLDDDQRYILWDRLTKLLSKHRQFPDAIWALNEELLSTIEEVAQKLAPSNPLSLNRHLFSNQDYDPFKENTSWQEQRDNLEARRQQALHNIMAEGSIESVIQFAQSVQAPDTVGNALGCIADSEVDSILLPKYLALDDRKLFLLTKSYVWSRNHAKGWADGLEKSDWNTEQIGQFLNALPFTSETWDRVVQWLDKRQNEYWQKTDVRIHQADGNLRVAIEKLLEYKRPKAAIQCLYFQHYDDQAVDVDQCVQALLAAVSSPEPSFTEHTHYIVQLIIFLQVSPNVSQDILFPIEWAYLPLLDRYQEAAPKSLENCLATDPEFFCEVHPMPT